jgi:hypothetical protein
MLNLLSTVCIVIILGHLRTIMEAWLKRSHSPAEERVQGWRQNEHIITAVHVPSGTVFPSRLSVCQTHRAKPVQYNM